MQASSDQTNVDLLLPFFVWMSVSMYITVIGVVIMTCQVAWPSVVLVVPLLMLNLWFRVKLLDLDFFFLRLGVTRLLHVI